MIEKHVESIEKHGIRKTLQPKKGAFLAARFPCFCHVFFVHMIAFSFAWRMLCFLICEGKNLLLVNIVRGMRGVVLNIFSD